MKLFLGIEIPIFLLFQIVASIIFGFFIWRNKKKLDLAPEKIFDFIILYFFSGLLIARILYIFHNFDHFSQLSWSIYPYYYLPGAERVWFKQLPWTIVKFWDDGIIYSGILFGNISFMVVYFIRRKLSAKRFLIVIKAFLASAAILLIGFFIAGSYLGEQTQLPFGMKYPSDPGINRIPIQFIEIIVLFIIFWLINYFKKIKRYKLGLGVFLFLFGWLEIAIQFLVDDGGTGHKIGILHMVYLIFIIFGIVILAFSLQQTRVSRELLQDTDRDKMSRRIEQENGEPMSFSYRDFSKVTRSDKVSNFASLANKIKRKLKRK